MTFRKLLLVLVAGGLAFSGAAIAQDDDDHGLISVLVIQLKPGNDSEYRDLAAQLAASRKAAGHSGVSVYQVIRGQGARYYSVSTVDNYATFDGQFDSGMSEGDWARWLGRMSDIMDNVQTMTMRTHPELTIAAESDSPPNMFQLRFTTLNPGTGGDHHEWLRESLVPALREGNTKGWNVSSVTAGDDVNTWISARRLDAWADLDGPGPLSHLSQRAWNNLLDDYNERAHSARVEIIRFLPELSY